MADSVEKDMKRMDRAWVFTFFGTAIGAGILFVPLQAGLSGFYVSIVSMVIAFSVTYFAQKYFAVVIAESQKADSYNAVITEFLGKGFSLFISTLFAVQLFASILVYSIGLNTDIGAFLQTYKITTVNVADYKVTPLVVLVVLTLPMLFSERFLIKFLDKISFVLIIFIALFILLFIPFWHFDYFFKFNPDIKLNIKMLLMSIPLYMGAINFYAALSPMIMFYRKTYPHLTHDDCVKKSFEINKKAICLLSFFTAFFVLSSAMTLTPEALNKAISNNISILAVVGLDQHSVMTLEVIKFLGYFVIFFALSTSFYGLMLAQIEIVAAQIFPKSWNEQLKRKLAIILMMFLFWFLTTFNINILKILGLFTNPSTGLTLFIIPTVIVLINQRFKKYRSITTYIILAIGIFMLFSYFIGLVM